VYINPFGAQSEKNVCICSVISMKGHDYNHVIYIEMTIKLHCVKAVV